MAIITLIDTMLSLILSPQVIDAYMDTCTYTTRIHTQKQYTRLYTYVNTHVLTNAQTYVLTKARSSCQTKDFRFCCFIVHSYARVFSACRKLRTIYEIELK